jgi:hypothetical protein
MLAAVFYHMTPEIPGVESATATGEVEEFSKGGNRSAVSFSTSKDMDDTEGVEVSPR